MSKEIIEALKEGGRIVLMGLVSYLLTEGVIDTLVTMFGGSLDATAKMLISGAFLSVVRSVDKWLHLKGTTEEEETGKTSALTLGLTRF